MPQTIDAIVFAAAGEVEIRQVPLPPMTLDEIAVKMLWTMVCREPSCGCFPGGAKRSANSR